MIKPKDFDETVIARLLEFWDGGTPWQRSLWNPGSIALLRELLDASHAVARSLLSQGIFEALRSDVTRLTGLDRAVGDQTTKKTLNAILRNDLIWDRSGCHELKYIIPHISEGYLTRCASLASASADQPGAERFARYIASHLLTGGFAPDYLHRWLTFRAKYAPDSYSLEDILLEAETDLVARPSQSWVVLIPVLATPQDSGSDVAGWRSPSQMVDLIKDVEPGAIIPRQNGGFMIDVVARDHFAAVEVAEEKIGRWATRVELGTQRALELAGSNVWVQGVSQPMPLSRRTRRVKIGALAREQQLFTDLDDEEEARRIDDALQILRPILGESRSAAIVGGWAAIESLLTSPGETKAEAADRVAAIAACSYPRAELTTLSRIHGEHSEDDLASRLSGITDNLGAASATAEALVGGQLLAGRGHQDVAAGERMRRILASPRQELAKVREAVRMSLTRIYRQRNLIVHGGIVSGEDQKVALGMAAPLIGATFDRIAHAWFTERLSPIRLAARANLHLELVTSIRGPGPVELLEPRS